MSLIDFEIQGGKDLEKALKALAPDLAKRAVKVALRRGAAVIRKEARLLVPKRTGNLRKSIAVVMRRPKNGVFTVSVATRKGLKYDYIGNHAHLIEFGHQTKSGGSVAAQPFLRPALDAKSAEAIKEMSKTIAEQLKIFAVGAKTKTQYKKMGFV